MANALMTGTPAGSDAFMGASRNVLVKKGEKKLGGCFAGGQPEVGQ
jgi:hypothetical protein